MEKSTVQNDLTKQNQLRSRRKALVCFRRYLI